MLNREFARPLLFAGAPLGGGLLARPVETGRITAFAPAVAERDEVIEGVVVSALAVSPALEPAPATNVPASLEPPPGPEPPPVMEAPPEPPSAAEPVSAAPSADAAAAGADAGEAAGAAAPDGLPSDHPAEVDLAGYGAYERVATGTNGLSRDQLVERYAHLVKYVVGRLGVSVPGLFDHEDAMQAGVVGLLRAIDAYRPESAASFESYAILRIRGSILDAVRALDTVGRAGREAARAIQGAIRELQHELGRAPTEAEIAGRLGLTVARYRDRLQSASIVTVSLDERDSREGDDEQTVLADNAPDPNAIDPAEEAARRDAVVSLAHEISRLGQRAQTVLGLYYHDEMTFKEIGAVLGVTESRVCQIHTEAILTLRGRLLDPDVAARIGRRRAGS